MHSGKVAGVGLMVALAMVFSYIESLFPVSLGIPGIKLGLSNVVTVFALYRFNPLTAFGIAIVRIILNGLTFGSLSTMMYSLAGGLFSYFVMLLLKRKEGFSVYGVSIAGGVCHNLGQVAVAVVVLQTGLLVYYIPFLLIAGTVAGVAIGYLSGLLLKRLQAAE